MYYTDKRIAFVHDDFPFGGAERVTLDLANYMSSIGYDVYVFTGTFHLNKLPVGISLNFKIVQLPEPGVAKSKRDALYMIDYIKKENIKVLVGVVLDIEHIKQIIAETNCRYIFAHHGTPFWEAQIKVDMAYLRSRKSFSARLEWYFISYPKYIWFEKHKARFYKNYLKTYNIADYYTVLCDDYKTQIAKALKLNVTNNKIRVIPNSEKTIDSPNLDKKKQILFVGRLSYSDKRVDRLIDIWERVYDQLSDWELIIIGDGEEKENLMNRVQKSNLLRIRFVGATSNVQAYYKEASILCLVSTFEGWGLCLTEAQSNGVVPIAFDCSAGVHSILSPSGVNGVLVPPFDLNRFAKELVALANDSDKLAQMRLNVLNKSKEYSIEVVGKMWMDLFDELIAK